LLKSLKDRLRKLNVAIAEVDHQGLWQRARLGVVAVSVARDGVDRSLDPAVGEIDRQDSGLIVNTAIDWLS